MMGMCFNWAPTERIDLLKKLWTDGLSATQIATEFNFAFPDDHPPTRCSILGKVHRLGLECRVFASEAVPKEQAPRPRRNGGSVISAIKAAKKAYEALGEAEPFVPRVLKPTEPTPTVMFCELTYGDCKYFSSEPSYDVMCCGAPAILGTSYCNFHSRIVYQKVKSAAQRQAELDSAARARAGKIKKAAA